MATEATDNQESIAADLGSIDVPRIGTDCTGAVHYYDQPHDRVLVARDGDIERVQPLEGRPVSDWIGYVGSERGWRARGDAEWFAQVERIAEAADV